ncbi:MAG: NUDIX domain-containing protein [Desulfobulbaceae bacterium]|jgi:isopentenyldiphosphate isomerase|nr:NUDIX domain-containing protein [Desulfobulbaceae bacterium]
MDSQQTNEQQPTEQVIIVDSENQEQMVVSRAIMREQNLIHRSAFTAVLNKENKILVLQRSQAKDLYPGAYEITCAGVVHPYESCRECAIRELDEELGIKKTSLIFLDLFYDENKQNRVWGSLYKTLWTGALRFNKEEVAWGTFLSFTEVETLIKQGSCTPETSFILELIQDS